MLYSSSYSGPYPKLRDVGTTRHLLIIISLLFLFFIHALLFDLKVNSQLIKNCVLRT